MLCSVINYSDVASAGRLDAEYFQRKYLYLQKKLERGKYKKLHELCEFIQTGPAGSALPAAAYSRSGIKVYRPSNLDGWSCDNADVVSVPQDYCLKKSLYLYRFGDILITRIGDIKFGIIQEKAVPVTISPNLIALRTKRGLLDPYFLLVFLHTKLGLPQIQRGKKIASLAYVGIEQIVNMLVPAVPFEFQTKISKMARQGLTKIQLAKRLYSETENALLQMTGFSKIRQTQCSVNVKISLLRQAQRLDAEYFLSQKNIHQKSIKIIQIGSIVKVYKGINPGRKAYQKNGKLFLRVSNISKYGLLPKSQKYISTDLYEKLRKKYEPKVNEILLVKDGKPGVAFTINKPIEGIISEGIVRLQIKCHDTKNISPEYISLCINSPICRSQILAHRDGSIMPHLKTEQIKKLEIPLPDERTLLTNNIKKSIALFQESEEMFKSAVRQTEELFERIN